MGRDLILEGFIPFDEVALGHHSFRCLYVGFHPRSRSLIVHDGHAARVYADGRLIYSYEKLGAQPRVAGDTHGAMAWSRDLLFIGGWLKAPPGVLPNGLQDMRSKFSHIHAIDEANRVDLIWWRKWDNKIPPNHWYGEVTDLLYDAHEDAVYFTRADGHAELGLWRIELRERRAEYLAEGTIYKMELKDDKIYATLFNPALMEDSAIVIYNMRDGSVNRVSEFEFALDQGKRIKVRRRGGQIVQLQNRLISFYAGILVYIQPDKGRYMAFPFLETNNPEDNMPYHVGGVRSQKAYVYGIPLVAFNPWDHLKEQSARADVTLLMRIDAVVPQIMASMGFISGMATDGEYLYLGTSHTNHTGVYTYRSGMGGVFKVPVNKVLSKPLTPVRLWLWDGAYSKEVSGLSGWFGGIPLKGFSKRRLKVRVDRQVELTIAEYSLSGHVRTDSYQLKGGWNVIDLEQYDDIVAFKLSDNTEVSAEVVLEP